MVASCRDDPTRGMVIEGLYQPRTAVVGVVPGLMASARSSPS